MRSPSFELLRQLRVAAAAFFSFGISLVVRWVPTHRNPADAPSRGRAMQTVADRLRERDEKEQAEINVDDLWSAVGRDGPVEAYESGWHL